MSTWKLRGAKDTWSTAPADDLANPLLESDTDEEEPDDSSPTSSSPYLPDELWCVIFEVLTPEDRMVARLTCRRWARVIRSRPRWKKEKIRLSHFLLDTNLFYLMEKSLMALPLSRLLPIACRGEDSEPFFHLTSELKSSINPDVIAFCARIATNEEVKRWCAEWQTPLEDIRLYEAASSGSPRSARLALRAGATLVDWALSGAVEKGQTRSAVQLLKRGARDWHPDKLAVHPRHSLSPDQLRAVRACSKWVRVCG